jgi:hypothetical protein
MRARRKLAYVVDDISESEIEQSEREDRKAVLSFLPDKVYFARTAARVKASCTLASHSSGLDSRLRAVLFAGHVGKEWSGSSSTAILIRSHPAFAAIPASNRGYAESAYPTPQKALVIQPGRS